MTPEEARSQRDEVVAVLADAWRAAGGPDPLPQPVFRGGGCGERGFNDVSIDFGPVAPFSVEADVMDRVAEQLGVDGPSEDGGVLQVSATTEAGGFASIVRRPRDGGITFGGRSPCLEVPVDELETGSG